MPKRRQDFDVWQGETARLRIKCLDEANQPLDLSGLSLLWRLTVSVEDQTALVEKLSPTITTEDRDGSDDGAVVPLTPTELAALKPRRYRHELRYFVGADSNLLTIGTLTVYASSTG